MTAEELAKVEALVNEKIAEDIAVVTDVMNIEDAKKSGAMALFGENTARPSAWYLWEISPGNCAVVPM